MLGSIDAFMFMTVGCDLKTSTACRLTRIMAPVSLLFMPERRVTFIFEVSGDGVLAAPSKTRLTGMKLVHLSALECMGPNVSSMLKYPGTDTCYSVHS